MNAHPNRCPMHSTPERLVPKNREVAFAIQLHDDTTTLFSQGHVSPEDFEKGLAVLETHIRTYRQLAAQDSGMRLTEVPFIPATSTDDARRIKKGKALAAMGHVQRDDEGGFEVTTHGRQRCTYRVWRDDAGYAQCSCATFQESGDRRFRCEHLFAVKFFLEPPAEEG